MKPAASYQPEARIKDRVIAFMRVHGVRRAEMAKILRTPFGTLNHWLRDEANPPGVMELTMSLLETLPEARRVAGVPEAMAPAARQVAKLAT
jgi:DNA-binding transcriptional regulator YiaG